MVEVAKGTSYNIPWGVKEDRREQRRVLPEQGRPCSAQIWGKGERSLQKLEERILVGLIHPVFT